MCVCVWGGGDVFENTFRIIGFDGIKCRWVAEQDFYWSAVLGSTLHFFSRPDWLSLCSFGRGLKDLFPHPQVRGQSFLWLLILMMLQGTWICLTCDLFPNKREEGPPDRRLGFARQSQVVQGWMGLDVCRVSRRETLCGRNGLICSKLCNFFRKGFT